MDADKVKRELCKYADPRRAESSQWFFKTGKGQYGEGDIFIGVSMPQIRQVCKIFRSLPLTELQILLDSSIHEHRMAAVVIMADVFKRSDAQKQKLLYMLYLKNVRNNRINNWDLIDVSAPHVVGEYLVNEDADVLYKLAKSDHLWSKRTAVLATGAFLKRGDPKYTYKTAEILLHDKHDLIQKAVGWFLREMGKRVDEKLLINFLDSYCREMPRVMLRYSIERLSEKEREKYLKTKITK